jgi:hypothetical protein
LAKKQFGNHFRASAPKNDQAYKFGMRMAVRTRFFGRAAVAAGPPGQQYLHELSVI